MVGILLQFRSCRRHGFNPWVRKIPWRREWRPTPVFLLGESHGQRTLAGYGPQGHNELDTTEVSHVKFYNLKMKKKKKKKQINKQNATRP